MYLLGLDIGSSSIKAAIVNAYNKQAVATASFPSTEMTIHAPQLSWAEQDPDMWWEYASKAIKICLNSASIDSSAIKAIGISYQMHGLVAVDKQGKPVRPSIIWCDSRAVNIGDLAAESLGVEFCSAHYLNTPGNFTASKIKWVKENEPHIYEKIDKIMLPGDYIAFKMTGQISTTISGLSEGVLWDFKENGTATDLLNHYGIEKSLLPEIRPTFSHQGMLKDDAAKFLGLPQGIAVSYRAGDQPNNAMSLGVFEPGQIAGTGGTSGVVYAVTDQLVSDPDMRVNSFAHVNYQDHDPRVGVLLCINGCGIQYGWLRKLLGQEEVSYFDLEKKAAEIAVGSEGLSIISFGNGAERMLKNEDPGAQILNLNFNIHHQEHIYRAALEGIAFAFYYGIQSMQQMGISVNEMRVGNDNLFQSNIFSKTLATLSGASIHIVETTGAIGAALGAGVGINHFSTLQEAFSNQTINKTIQPDKNPAVYQDAYEAWSHQLNKFINKKSV